MALVALNFLKFFPCTQWHKFRDWSELWVQSKQTEAFHFAFMNSSCTSPLLYTREQGAWGMRINQSSLVFFLPLLQSSPLLWRNLLLPLLCFASCVYNTRNVWQKNDLMNENAVCLQPGSLCICRMTNKPKIAFCSSLLHIFLQSSLV